MSDVKLASSNAFSAPNNLAPSTVETSGDRAATDRFGAALTAAAPQARIGGDDLMMARLPSRSVTPAGIAAGLTRTFADRSMANDLRAIAANPAVASLSPAIRNSVMDEVRNILGTVLGAIDASGLLGADVLADGKITANELLVLRDLLANPANASGQSYADSINVSYGKIRQQIGETRMPQALKDIFNLVNPKI
jgi:hypothetical protein